jgi:MFS family permease
MMKKYIAICSSEMDTYSDYALFSIVSIFILNASTYEVGFLGACYAIPFYFLSARYGRYFDRTDVRPSRAVLFFICALCTPMILYIDSMVAIYGLLLFKTSLRVGLSTSMPKLNENKEESKQFYEVTGYILNLSRIGVPLVVITLYDQYGLSYVVGMSVFFSLLGLVTTLADGAYKPESSLDERLLEGASVRDLIRKNRVLFLLILTYIMSSISFYLSNDMLSVFFRYIGEEESSIGYLITILGVGGVIGTKVASATLKKIPPISVFTLSILTNASSFAVLGFTDTESTAVLFYYGAIFVTGIASGIAFVSLKLGSRRTVKFSQLATVTGYIQKIAALVAMSLPILGGVTSGVWGLQNTFTITAVLLGGVFIYALRQKDIKPPVKEPQS